MPTTIEEQGGSTSRTTSPSTWENIEYAAGGLKHISGAGVWALAGAARVIGTVGSGLVDMVNVARLGFRALYPPEWKNFKDVAGETGEHLGKTVQSGKYAIFNFGKAVESAKLAGKSLGEIGMQRTGYSPALQGAT